MKSNLHELSIMLEEYVGVKSKVFVLLIASTYAALLGLPTVIQATHPIVPAIGMATQIMLLMGAFKLNGRGLVSKLVNTKPFGFIVLCLVLLAVNFTFWQTLTLANIVPPNVMVVWGN